MSQIIALSYAVLYRRPILDMANGFILIANSHQLLVFELCVEKNAETMARISRKKGPDWLGISAKDTDEEMAVRVSHTNHPCFIGSRKGLEHWQVWVVLRMPIAIIIIFFYMYLLAFSWL